jgi:hypothetical protein
MSGSRARWSRAASSCANAAAAFDFAATLAAVAVLARVAARYSAASACGDGRCGLWH